jgi:hypothetical protein
MTPDMRHLGPRLRLPGRATPASELDLELAQEMASALGRLGRQLEATLRALTDFDAAGALDEDGPADRGLKTQLVMAAADAYWCFVVQRESYGLFDVQLIIDHYKVPVEVQRHAGIAPAMRPLARTQWLR